MFLSAWALYTEAACVKNEMSKFYLVTKILNILHTAFSFHLCQFSQGWVFIFEGKKRRHSKKNITMYTVRCCQNVHTVLSTLLISLLLGTLERGQSSNRLMKTNESVAAITLIQTISSVCVAAAEWPYLSGASLSQRSLFVWSPVL